MHILHIPLLWWYSRLEPRWLGPLPFTASGFLYAAVVVTVSANRLIRGLARAAQLARAMRRRGSKCPCGPTEAGEFL